MSTVKTICSHIADIKAGNDIRYLDFNGFCLFRVRVVRVNSLVADSVHKGATSGFGIGKGLCHLAAVGIQIVGIGAISIHGDGSVFCLERADCV